MDRFTKDRREALWRIGLGPRKSIVPGKSAATLQSKEHQEKHLRLQNRSQVQIIASNFGQGQDRSRGRGVRQKPQQTLKQPAGLQLSLFSDPLSQGGPLDPTSTPPLRALTTEQQQSWDFSTQQMSVQSHPILRYRGQLSMLGALTIAELFGSAPGGWVKTAGWVLVRQRPPTAKGMMFLMLEDETGRLQVAITPDQAQRHLSVLLAHNTLLIAGHLEAPTIGSSATSHRSLRLKEVHALNLHEGTVTILPAI